MKVTANEYPGLVLYLQGAMLISFNPEQITKEGMNGTETMYQYDQVKVAVSSSRDQIIEAIMASRYTVGAELACINNKDAKPEDYEAYMAFRIQAKEISDQVLNPDVAAAPVPDSTWLKADIQSWLTAHAIEWMSTMLKADLLALVP